MSNEELYQLLKKYRANRCTPEEVKRIENWYHQFDRNAESIPPIPQEKLEQLWFTIKATLKRKHKRRLEWVRWGAAASVILLLAAGWWFLTEEPSENSLPLATSGRGNQGVKLVLSSGDTVCLGEDNKEFKESQGISVIVDSSGNIRYKNSTKGNTPTYNTIATPRGKLFTLVLSDGSKVWMNAESQLIYPITFTGKERRVKLNGEAYFEVTPNETQPFIVEADKAMVKVYGTEFNVNCYPGNTIETVLITGSVILSQGTEEVKLQPGEKGSITQGKPGIQVSQVETSAYIAWKNGDFAFHGKRLEEVMTELARWYDVDVFYAKPALKEEELYVYTPRYDDITKLLHLLEQVSNAHFELKGRTLTVK